MHMYLCLKKHVIPNITVNVELKNIYRGDEVKFAAMFRALQSALLADFITAHPEFLTSKKSSIVAQGFGVDYNKEGQLVHTPTDMSMHSNGKDLWKAVGIKSPVVGLSYKDQSVYRSRYPTAFALVEAFGDACQMAGYSIVEPNAIIYRHTGVENRDAKSIRIHIPLYVPEGDIGIEVEGEIVRWDDVFSFNNQKLHSVWNDTPERRLVLLIDLSREICELPPAPAHFTGCNAHVPVFEKTRDPKYNR